jgi:hypothetical protein
MAFLGQGFKIEFPGFNKIKAVFMSHLRSNEAVV